MAVDGDKAERLKEGRQQTRPISKKFNIKRVLECLSSLLLPLALGVFTAVITLQQQKIAQQQRDEDREAAYLQRLEDQKAAEKLRELEQNISDTRYLDDVLNNYIKDMAELMKENNGSLTAIDFVSTLARAKTLNVLRQLDAQRNARVIRFLHEAEQLPTGNFLLSIDLSTAKLCDIDFRQLAINEEVLKNISLTGMILQNALLRNMKIDDVSFVQTQFDRVDAKLTSIRRADFTLAKLVEIDFSSSSLRTVNCHKTRIVGANFSDNTLQQVDFSLAQLRNVSFASATLRNIDFGSAKLTDVDFSFALLKNINFSSAELRNVNFTYAQLQKVDVSRTQLYHVNFSSKEPNHHYLYGIDFKSSILNNADFTCVNFHEVDFSYSRQFLTDFSSAILVSADFFQAKLFNTNFTRSRCLKASFNEAGLSNANFSYANAKGASFYFANVINVSFDHANLQKTFFNQSDITENQLRSALSIHDVWLPNETRIRDPNLILDGEAYCNMTLSSSWQLQLGQVNISQDDGNAKNCRYTLQSLGEGAIMSQKIALSTKMNVEFQVDSHVVLTARASPGVSIQLIGIARTNRTFAARNLTEAWNTTRLKLEADMQAIEVRVHFYPLLNASDQSRNWNRWCADLFLHIDYGPDIVAPYRLEPIICDAEWNQNATPIGGRLRRPYSLFVDEQQTVYIAELGNSRIVAWRTGATTIEVAAGQKNAGDRLDQLDRPTDVVVDRKTDALLICDRYNRRVVRWPRRRLLSGDNAQGEIVISNVTCFGLTMDDQGALYVSDIEKSEVRRYENGGQDNQGTVIAGGHGTGAGLHQLNTPTYLFVDAQSALYVSDTYNHRVMKWVKGATSGIVIAGGNGMGDDLKQLWYPRGIWVDGCGHVYVVDQSNNRVVRWKKEETEGTVMVGRNGQESETNQLSNPEGLVFDQDGQLYVADYGNNRVQRFSLLV